MATGSGAFSTKPGYNQSGGAYLMVLETGQNLVGKLLTYAGGSGSGGATTVGSFAAAGAAAWGTGNTSSLFANGRLVRDMGKTIISAGRSFRKIQAVAEGSATTVASFGVTGVASGVANSVDAGYLSFYVETGREGSSPSAQPAILVRFM